jgi:hypothetical protein
MQPRGLTQVNLPFRRFDLICRKIPSDSLG